MRYESITRAYLDIDLPLLISITPERMTVFLAVHVDALPAQLLDGDKRLVDVRVLGDEVRPEVQRKAFGVQNMWGRLCEVCASNAEYSLENGR